jgi:hypothetical protein
MNPEFRRNIWLEITTHRLVGMPFILALVLLAIATTAGSNAMRAVNVAALFGFAALTILWGSRLALNSILDEVTDKTWDWQRLSTLSPWAMTWGKLFGSTAFAWYGGLLCLLVHLVTVTDQSFYTRACSALSLILTALTFHAAALATALHMSRHGIVSKRRSLGLLLILLVIALNIGSVVIIRSVSMFKQVNWYSFELDLINFALCSAAAFASWGLTGAYRSMCNSLMVRTTPWVWPLFLTFLIIYTAGFFWSSVSENISTIALLASVGMAWALVFTYAMVFTELTTPSVTRRIIWKAQNGERRRMFEELPCWPITWAYALICALLVTMYHDGSTSNLPPNWDSVPLALTLIAARDCGILLLCLAAPQPRRAVGTALIYIAVLIWILPMLLRAMNLPQVASLLLPLGEGNTALQLVSALIQAVVALGLAWQRHRKWD